MPGILMVSHGNLASEFLKTMEIIMGTQEGVEAVGLYPGEGFEILHSKINDAISRINDGSGLLIFVDLFGGTPFNVCFDMMSSEKDKISMDVIAGMNLAMVIEACTFKSKKSLEELINLIKDTAQESVRVCSELVSGL